MDNGEPQKSGGDLPRVGDAYLIKRFDAVEHEQAEAKKRDDHHKTQQLEFNRKLVRYTLGLFVVSALGTGISVWQSLIAQRAANAAKSAADTAGKGLAETRTATNAAETQLLLTLGSMDQQIAATQLERRAWVGVLSASIRDDTVAVIVQNSGSTPALRLRNTTMVTVLKINEPFVATYDPPTGQAPEAVIQPSGNRDVGSPLPPTHWNDALRKTFSDRTNRLYVYGKLDYRDIFSGTPERHTTFCMYLAPDLRTWRTCATYNHAD